MPLLWRKRVDLGKNSVQENTYHGEGSAKRSLHYAVLNPLSRELPLHLTNR